jgi:hypothetical protein
MILSELKNYLQAQQRVPLKDLSYRFDVEPDALRGMLQRWIQKGYLKQLDTGTPCGTGCSKCDPKDVEIYEWVKNA